MQAAEPGDFDIVAGHVAVEAGGSESVRVQRARLHVEDDGTWRARVELQDGALRADDVEVTLLSDLCAWSGRGHVVSRVADGALEIAGNEGLTVTPAVGA